MKKKLISILTAAAVVGTLTGCSSKNKAAQEESNVSTENGQAAQTQLEENNKEYLQLAWSEDIPTADAHKCDSSYAIPMNIFDRLVEVGTKADGSTEIVPSLADTWDISEDGLTYTFHLKKGVKYSNGNDFTAEDVAYSLKRMLTVEGAVNISFVDQIKGAKELYDGTAAELEGVKVIDDYTIEITLKEPYAGFLACLSSPAVSIYDSEATQAAGDKFGLDPAVTIGTGAFTLESWNVNSEIVLKKNDSYWGNAFTLPGIRIQIIPDAQTQSMMYENGELDIFDLENVPDSTETYMKKYGDKVIGTTRVAINYVTMNENITPFDNVQVRKAVQMAIDRQGILDAIYGGRGQLENGIFPKNLIGHNDNLDTIAYDQEQAKQLLADAGYADGFDMEIASNSSSDSTTSMVEQIIVSQLAQVGIRAKIKNYDDSTWFETRKKGELPTFVASWSADYNDPDNFIYTFYGNEGNTKSRSINYSNADVMKRVQAARAIIDENTRIKEYQDLEKTIVLEDAAWVPLYSRLRYFAVSDRVAGFQPLWNGWSEIFYKTVELK